MQYKVTVYSVFFLISGDTFVTWHFEGAVPPWIDHRGTDYKSGFDPIVRAFLYADN